MSNPAFKTKYSFKWEEKFRWVTKSEEPDSAKCTLCNKSFCIDGSEYHKSNHTKGQKPIRRRKIQTLIREHLL